MTGKYPNFAHSNLQSDTYVDYIYLRALFALECCFMTFDKYYLLNCITDI